MCRQGIKGILYRKAIFPREFSILQLLITLNKIKKCCATIYDVPGIFFTKVVGSSNPPYSNTYQESGEDIMIAC